MISTSVFFADTNSLCEPSLYEAAYSCVTDARRKKVEKLRFMKDKRLSLGAELLLGYALSKMGKNIHAQSFYFGPQKKPYIESEPPIFFNLSHSGSLSLCAISHSEIGCDVEKITSYKDRVAKRFFAKEENDILDSKKSESEREDIFYRIWTLKESYIKATGKGMEMPLNSFSITIENDGIGLNQSKLCENYYFREFNIGADYKCAICGIDPAIVGPSGPIPKKIFFGEDFFKEIL